MMDSSNLLLAETQEGEGLDRPGAQMQTRTHIETEIWGYQRLAGTKKLGGQQVCVCVWGGGGEHSLCVSSGKKLWAPD